MKLKTVLIIVAIASGLAFLFYAMQDRTSPEAYLKEIEKERSGKDDFMRTSAESPFKTIAYQYKGLQYFPPDRSYKVKASIVPIEDKKIVSLTTSDGLENEYLEFGYAEFKLKNQEQKLLILEVRDPGPSHGTLFLAFSDSTSARETYGAGRYLEIKKIPAMTSVTLDFNKAYNPYCAYGDNFSCPLPPRENILKIAVRAGEKSYH